MTLTFARGSLNLFRKQILPTFPYIHNIKYLHEIKSIFIFLFSTFFYHQISNIYVKNSNFKSSIKFYEFKRKIKNYYKENNLTN